VVRLFLLGLIGELGALVECSESSSSIWIATSGPPAPPPALRPLIAVAPLPLVVLLAAVFAAALPAGAVGRGGAGGGGSGS